MWSVWSEPLDLYVGPSGALVKVGKSDAVEIAHSGDTPPDRRLERLFEDIASANLLSVTRSYRLRISLSGAYCPAVAYSVPAQVTRWGEICEIASATAAATDGTSADQVVCEVDTSGGGITVVLILMGVFDIILFLGGVLAVIMVIYGGFKFVTSTGEPQKIAAGRTTIINALVGLGIAIIASQIVGFIAGRLS